MTWQDVTWMIHESFSFYQKISPKYYFVFISQSQNMKLEAEWLSQSRSSVNRESWTQTSDSVIWNGFHFMEQNCAYRVRPNIRWNNAHEVLSIDKIKAIMKHLTFIESCIILCPLLNKAFLEVLVFTYEATET